MFEKEDQEALQEGLPTLSPRPIAGVTNHEPQGAIRKRPIGTANVQGKTIVGNPKPVVVRAAPAVAKREAVVAVGSENLGQSKAVLPVRPKFEEAHRRRTIYLENSLDSKVQQICKSHLTYRSMSSLIQAALLDFIKSKKM